MNRSFLKISKEEIFDSCKTKDEIDHYQFQLIFDKNVSTLPNKKDNYEQDD